MKNECEKESNRGKKILKLKENLKENDINFKHAKKNNKRLNLFIHHLGSFF